MKDTDQLHFLNYNVQWMESVFRSRNTAEALLNPQHEAGNLTSHDYTSSLDFLPGYHRHYPVIGAAVASSASLSIRTQKFKRSTLVFASLLTGYTIGKAFKLTAHTQYLSSIEDPEGFRRAIDSIQKELGMAPTRGLVLTRPFKPLSHQESSDNGISYPPLVKEVSLNRPPELSLVLPSSSSSSDSPQDPSPDETKASSRWEEIRKAHNNTTRNSTWDTLRQKHERELVRPATTDKPVWDQESAEKPDGDKYADNGAFGRSD